MKVSFDRIGYPLYCDIGPNAGDMLIDLKISLYLSQEEYAKYEGTKSLQITLGESGGRPPRAGNTAKPSGEPSVGDIVCVGEVALAVARPAGWEPASGPLTEVRTREHGTSPLPLPLHGRALGSGPAPDPRKEDHGE